MPDQSSPIISVGGSVVTELNALRASESSKMQEGQAVQAKAGKKKIFVP